MKTRRTALALLALAFVSVAGLAACEPTKAGTPGERAVAAARAQTGKPYRSGGASPSTGFDCSGLTSYAWAQAGVTIPRTSAAQYTATQRVTKANLLPGDLVFYSSAGPGGRISHVAMYAGGGKIIQAQKAGVPVKEQSIDWWASNRVGYGRVRA